MRQHPILVLFIACILFLSTISISLPAQNGSVEELTMLAGDKHQTVVGFGASLAYYENWLNSHPNKSEIYQAIFGELSLDILRVRNAYDYDLGMINRVKEYMDAAEWVLGHPISLLSTSWGPPGYLKNTGDRKNGGTLRYTAGPGGVAFDYAGFAHWWGKSLDEYNSRGIYPAYISIQNEPDFSATWESCLLKPYETVNGSDTIAGYNKALDAVYDTVMQRIQKPKILGPETVGIGYNSVENYVNAMDLSKLDGIAHHLYHGVNENNPYSSTDFSKVGAFHPEVPHFQTEYSRGDWFSLAGLIYKSFYEEEVVAYLYWDLIWNEKGLVTLDNPWDQSQWTDPLKGYVRTKEFYAFKQFSAFIHPGWQMIGHTMTGDNNASVTFISPGIDSAVCVLINRSATDDLSVHLDIPGYRIYESAIYATSVNEDCELTGSLVDSLLTLSPWSISTIDMRIAVYDPADDTVAPSVPTNVSIIDSTGFSLSVEWDASTDNFGVSGYSVYLDGTWVGTANTTIYVISGLNANTSYEIAVAAFDNVPNFSEQSASVRGATTSPDTLAPSTPENLTINEITQTSLALSWNPSTDNVEVTGYLVYVNNMEWGTALSNAITITQLIPGTEYQISVRAYDASSNESEPAQAVSGTTLDQPDTVPPTPPVNVKVTATTDTSLAISWFPSLDNVGVTGYRIYVDGMISGSTTTESFLLSQLVPNTVYRITVSAIDASSNESGTSLPLDAKTSMSVGIRDLYIPKLHVYPNPFSRSTTFQMTLIDNQTVWLMIIDSQGRVVSKRTLRNLIKGDHSILFGREGLRAGLYLFRLETSGGFYRSGQLIIRD